MEKHSHVFERFATFDNMYDGYLLARRQKRYKAAVLDYSAHLEENIIDAVNRLQWKMYEPGELHPFYEYFPKVRLIHSLPFYDRVVNCAAYKVLWPIYFRSMYEHSYGFASFNGNNPRSNTNTNIGFRAALPSSQMWHAHGHASSATVMIKGSCFLGQQ